MKVRKTRIASAVGASLALTSLLFLAAASVGGSVRTGGGAAADRERIEAEKNVSEGIEIETIEIFIEELPQEFDGFRIAHLSDLHERRFGNGQTMLLEEVAATEPDLLLLTGDILDMRRRDPKPVAELLAGIAGLTGRRRAFIVTGNHEHHTPLLPWLEDAVREAGVRMLRNEAVRLQRGEATLLIAGVDDVAFFPHDAGGIRTLEEALERVTAERRTGEPVLLLSHRPERLDDYAEADIDLVFTGHAHGGQIRLPLLGGIFAPDQGFLPRYTSGRYRRGSTVMIVSRGLANTVPMPRFGNPFHLPLVILRSGAEPPPDARSSRAGVPGMLQ